MSSMDEDQDSLDTDAPRSGKKPAGFKIKGGRASFVQVPTAVIADPDISHTAFRLWCLLCAYAAQRDDTWVGQAVLAEALGVTDRHIRTLMESLKTAGLVLVENRGARNTNLMTLAGDDDIRDLYAGSLGTELPRKRPNDAQSDLGSGTRVPPLAAVDAKPKPMDIQEAETEATVLPMSTRKRAKRGDRNCGSGRTGTGVPVRREVDTEKQIQQEQQEQQVEQEQDLVDERVRLTYVHNDEGLTAVFLGPGHLQDAIKAAGCWDEFLGAAFLAKNFQTHVREQVLEMCMDPTLPVQDQVIRWKQAVLDVRSGRW